MYEQGLINTELRKKAKKRIPFSCHLDLTYHCNLKCVHCYVVEEDRAELNTEQIKDLLNQLASAGTLYLHLSGGEVLLREDFFEIADYARKLHFAMHISTNGTLINEEIAKKLSDLNLTKVKISVFSHRPEIHDSITKVNGSQTKAINGIKMLKKRGITVQLVDIIMNQNVDDYPQVFKLAKELGADFKADQHVTPKVNGNIKPLIYQISLQDERKVLTDPLLNPETDFEGREAPHSTSFLDDLACDAAQSFFYISPYGDVFPCVQFPLQCGNVLERSFEEIWYNSSQMLSASNFRTSKIQKCDSCQFFNYCNFCPGLALLETGTIFSPYERACKEAEILFNTNFEMIEK